MDETPLPSFPTIRILVVDDFERWRRSICSILSGYQQLHVVGQVADGQEAVQKAQELQPDLILLDISLPKLSGLEAASRIRQVAPGAKIIFLTQHSDVDTVRVALSTGARGYVLKVDAGSKLLPAIQTVLRGENFISERLINRRRARRVQFAAPAVLQTGPTEIQSKFVNFSEMGCFVETSRRLPTGSQVRLSFGMQDLVLGCNAIVRHRNEKGIGLEFIQLDPGTQAAFRTLANLTGGSA